MRTRHGYRAAAVVLLLLFVVVLVRTAWLCDDSYITFRVVDNLLNGHGLRWNVADRVQINTHPLWTFALAVGCAVIGEIYWTALLLSGIAAIAALLLLLRWHRLTPAAAVFALTAAITSKAFVDWSTGGLENPLTAAILVVFCWLFASHRPSPTSRGLLLLCLTAATALLNRVDLVWLLLPALLAAGWQVGPWRAFRIALLGFGPLLAWLLFALLYYGTPLPVPAYAKALSTGIPQSDLLAHGARYFGDSLIRDPVTLPVIALGALAGLLGPKRQRLWPLALGVVLHLAYVLKVGGDFMSGRFFVAPFVVAVVLVARSASVLRPWLGGLLLPALLLGAGLLGPRPSFLSGPLYERVDTGPASIFDERAVYYPNLGLLSPTRDIPQAAEFSLKHGDALPRTPIVLAEPRVGVFGFEAGPLVHVVDPLLCDPLLARLPAKDVAVWIPGHIERRVPEGYFETLQFGGNRLRHEGLAAYWDDLRLTISGDLFDPERLAAAWRVLFGAHAEGLRRFVAGPYREPPVRMVEAREIAEPVTGIWQTGVGQVVYAGGLLVRFEALIRADRVLLGLDAMDRYRVRFLHGGRVLGEQTVTTQEVILGGFSEYPVEAPDAEFDRIHIAPVWSLDRVYAVGHVRLSPN